MERHYSNLELAKFDNSARAPELDHDATAFELDTSASAPQVVPDSTPEVFFDTLLPEARDKVEETAREPSLVQRTTKKSLRRLRITFALIVATAIGTGVGVGVGTWRRRQHSRQTSESNPNTLISNTTHPILNHTSQVALGPILNDTSLASLASGNGDRYLFFQDNAGFVRQAIRTASDSRWSASADFKVSSNAKKHTPLAAIPQEDPEGVAVYYVSESHILNSSAGNGGSWLPSADLVYSSFPTAESTRSLSVTSISTPSGDFNGTINLALLFYENPNGNVSALLQRDGVSGFQFVDITSQESPSLPNEFRSSSGMFRSYTLYESAMNATFSAPFASGYNQSRALFYSPPSASLKSTIAYGCWLDTQYYAPSSGPVTFFESGFGGECPAQASPLLSDVASFGTLNRQAAIWINDTHPVAILLSGVAVPENVQMPKNPFPFARLASTTLDDGSVTFLYHQMNSTTIAEEKWDDSLSDWVSTEYITVSDSN